jgi:hypothetical protein
MMTQLQLDSAVARSTGEALGVVRRLGFIPLPDGLAGLEPEDLSLVVDCPFCGHSAPLPVHAEGLPAMAECDHCDIYFDFSVEEVYAAQSLDLATTAAVD